MMARPPSTALPSGPIPPSRWRPVPMSFCPSTSSVGPPVAPHDCTGPLVWMASVHLSLNAPHALIQGTVRAFYTGWYHELLTELPRVENGQVSLGSDAPGLGVALRPGLADRPDAVVRPTADR